MSPAAAMNLGRMVPKAMVPERLEGEGAGS